MSEANGHPRDHQLADGIAASHIDHLATSVQSAARVLAEDVKRFADRAGQGKFLGDDARNLAEGMVRLTWQASRLDGMREIAALHATAPQHGR